MPETKQRVVFIDYLRFIACFMVMLVHSCEPFYLGGQGTFILNHTDAVLVTAIDGFLRPCVPLFVMASSYLLFPVRTDARTFYTKRARRVLIPLLVWLVLYAVIPQYGSSFDAASAGSTFKQMLLNFPAATGHLWFVYMLLGIYLVMPIFSPWIEKVSRKGELAFLGLWLFTTLVPFLRLIALGVTGSTQLWGECDWNEFGVLYGVSGFIGYVVLGHYFRTHVGELSWKKTLLFAVPFILVGYAITALWFWNVMPKNFPVDSTMQLAMYMETSWRFCSFGVALMTIGFFLIIRKFNSTGWGYRNIILPVSGASYGMYLMHIFFLNMYFAIFHAAIGSTLAVILLTATCSYVSSFVVSHLVSRIPKVGKYIVG